MDTNKVVIKMISTLTPSFDKISLFIDNFKTTNQNKSRDELAELYADKICWKYASVGAITTLPAIVPGIGTAAQVATEGATLSSNLIMMIRWMGSMVAGISIVYEKDVNTHFQNDFIQVLGLWSGVLLTDSNNGVDTGTKIELTETNEITQKICNTMNKKVGTSIVKRRGGVAIGSLAPFGVGAIIGGSFNLATMKAFKNHAIMFYTTPEKNSLYLKD